MEINKQLFEDVLSGKLKGTFVFRNQLTCNSDELTNATDRYKSTHPYSIKNWSYTPSGMYHFCCVSNVDIVDFIPDMKENELTIEIPDGKVVDWDESKKQNRIILKDLKDKQLTYKDVCKELFRKEVYYYIDGDGSVGQENRFDKEVVVVCPNNATTEHQLECILAKNKLANVAKYLNDGWKPLSGDEISLLVQTSTDVSVFEVANGSCASDCGSIWFKSRKLAQQAIEILGEETIKLALEPLGI